MSAAEEEQLARNLRVLLAVSPSGADIPKSEQFQNVQSRLEFFIPGILSQQYPDWETESLDGFIPFVARKTRDRELEMFGLCWLISDQTQAPIHLVIQVASSRDELSYIRVRLGERGKNGMIRMKVKPKTQHGHLIFLKGKQDSINWIYELKRRRTDN